MNMRTNARHPVAARLLVALALALAMLAAPLGAGTAQARSIKASGAKFTAAGRVHKSKIWYWGAGLQRCTYSVKSVKVRNAKRAGYRTATVVLEVRESWKPTDRQIITMGNHADEDGYLEYGWVHGFAVDGRTGENLEVRRLARKHGVTVKTAGWRYGDLRYHYASDGSWVWISGYSRLRYTITYPKAYKDLCVGVGVGQRRCNESAMDRYYAGRVTYGSSWWHRHNGASTRFVRVR